MAQRPTGEKVDSKSTTNAKGVTTTEVVKLIVQDGKVVADTGQGVVV